MHTKPPGDRSEPKQKQHCGNNRCLPCTINVELVLHVKVHGQSDQIEVVDLCFGLRVQLGRPRAHRRIEEGLSCWSSDKQQIDEAKSTKGQVGAPAIPHTLPSSRQSITHGGSQRGDDANRLCQQTRCCCDQRCDLPAAPRYRHDAWHGG